MLLLACNGLCQERPIAIATLNRAVDRPFDISTGSAECLVNAQLLKMFPQSTNAWTYIELCRGAEFEVKAYASNRRPVVLQVADGLAMTLSQCEEIQIELWELPIVARFSESNALVGSYDKLAADISKIAIKREFAVPEGRRVEYSEIGPDGRIVYTEQGWADGLQTVHTHEGRLEQTLFERFCRTLELLNVRRMKSPVAFTGTGNWCELRIERGRSVQVLRWPQFVENEKELGDVRCSALSLIIDGLLSKMGDYPYGQATNDVKRLQRPLP